MSTETPEQLYVIVKRGLYYRPDAKGYTSCMCEAWKLPYDLAKKHEYIHPGADDNVTLQPASPSEADALRDELEETRKQRDDYAEESRRAAEYITKLGNLLGCADGDDTPEERIAAERDQWSEKAVKAAELVAETQMEANKLRAERDEARAEVARVNQFRENAAAKHQRVRDERDSLSAQLAEARERLEQKSIDYAQQSSYQAATEMRLHETQTALEASQARVRELEEKAARHEQERNERIESLDL